MGGTNAGSQPVELLLSSLISCETATSQFVARWMKPRMKMDSIEFNIEAMRDQRGSLNLPLSSIILNEKEEVISSKLQSITGTAFLTTVASQEEIDELKEHVEQRCPIANMIISSGCELDIQWKKK